MNIAFLGMGNYGRAIASLLDTNGHEYDYAEVAESRLLSRDADIVFITVPTHSVRQALIDNAKHLNNGTITVNCSKGIEERSHMLVHQVVHDSGQYSSYFSLIGPSFAQGIVAKEPTIVSLGYEDDELLNDLRTVIETPYFKVLPTKGYRALELASALKNLYAIACGYAAGLQLGANTQTKLIMVALNEFEALADALGYTHYSITSPGITGDLLLTCTSGQSRNYLYGRSLSDGQANAVDPRRTTVEGYHTSHSIHVIAKNVGLHMPLAMLVRRIVSGEAVSAESFKHYIGEL